MWYSNKCTTVRIILYKAHQCRRVEEVMKLSMELQKCLLYILSCVALTAAKSTSSNLFNANGEHRIVGVKFLSEF